MRDLAQTNLQLYEQLLELAWPESDLANAREAYDLACQLFSGKYRASGKTFVSHLVGTASAVADADGRPRLVTAGLLHAAYQQGDFGPRVPQARRRLVVRSAVGDQVEQLVFAYTQFPWNPETIRELLGNTSGLESATLDVLLVRLANEVDDHTDRGAQFAPRNGSLLYRDEIVDAMAELAMRVGYPELADSLDRSRADEEAPDVPLVLRSSADGSQVRPAASYMLRPIVRATEVATRLRRRVSALPVVPALYGQFRSCLGRRESAGGT